MFDEEMNEHHEDPTTAASATPGPIGAHIDTDDDTESQKRKTADFQTRAISPASHASLYTDVLPLQPNDMRESDPFLNLNELKETATAEKELSIVRVNMTSGGSNPGGSEATSEHDQRLEHQTAEFDSGDLTNSKLLPPLIGVLKPEKSKSATANQQAPKAYDQPSLSTVLQAPNSSEQETTPKQYLSPDRAPALQSHLPLPMPHPDWDFDDLLVDLNSAINSTDELNTMKDKFQSDFRKKVIDDIKSPRDLFRQMKQRQLISANNIIYLQSILMKLKRPDLVERTIDYCQRAGNVLHFKPATKTPENGYKYVKMHLHLDKAYTKDDMAQLQFRVASILCCPGSFVHLVAVEPSNSLLVTFMLPEMYVDILLKYLDQNLLHDKFAALGIDMISADGHVYRMKDNQSSDDPVSDQQLVSLYHQLSSKDTQLEGMENTCYKLRQKIEALETEAADKDAHLKESEEKRKQLKEKVERLEDNVENKVALIEDSDNRSKALEKKVKNMEKQLEDMINYLQKRDIDLITKLGQLEQENRELSGDKEDLLHDLDCLNNKIVEKDKDLQWLRQQLFTIYGYKSRK